MKKTLILLFVPLFLWMMACTGEDDMDIELPTDNISSFNYTEGQYVPIYALDAPHSQLIGSLEAFRRYQKPIDAFDLVFLSSSIQTHQLVFEFDGSYPVDEILLKNHIEYPMTNVSIDVSLNGLSFERLYESYTVDSGDNRIDLEGKLARQIRMVFPATQRVGLQDVRFTLSLGMIVKEHHEWSESFLRYSGWSGADGIFSFNLEGQDEIWSGGEHNLFIFSDTLVGEAYTHNHVRKNYVMINNSIAYYNGRDNIQDGLEFIYVQEDDRPKSMFEPDFYIGKEARNLLDGDGLSFTTRKEATLTNNSDGTMYLTDQQQATIEIDFNQTHHLGELIIWNYNDQTQYGTQDLTIEYSSDKETWHHVETTSIPKASGSNAATHDLVVSLSGIEASHLRLKLNEGYDANYLGLGKVMIFDQDDNYLFGQATGTPSAADFTVLDQSARIWLQDGVVLNNHLYVYPLLVKDFEDFFKVHNVGMIKIPIEDNRVLYENATMLNTPLQVQTDDGGIIYLGAGLMNHVAHDGYVYIYGYKDLLGRHLVVGRFLPQDAENFNKYEYYDGQNWVKDINQVGALASNVSAELSVTYITEGTYAGKFMLVVMENTTSGVISYAISDTPYTPFGEYQVIYRTTESSYLQNAFTYNAKLHPHISKQGRFLISYNVNGTTLQSLNDVRVYYPRFIEMIEVTRKD